MKKPEDLDPNSKINPRLEVGDRVMLFQMKGERLSPGTWGIAGEGMDAAGEWMYKVKWDDGDYENVGKPISSLSLSTSRDTWTKDPAFERRSKGIKNESYIISKKQVLNLSNRIL